VAEICKDGAARFLRSRVLVVIYRISAVPMANIKPPSAIERLHMPHLEVHVVPRSIEAWSLATNVMLGGFKRDF
jgi:hypothetical protein